MCKSWLQSLIHAEPKFTILARASDTDLSHVDVKARTCDLDKALTVAELMHLIAVFRPALKPNDRIYFRLSDVVGAQSQQVALNSEVSFVMVPDPRGHQDRAANVQILQVAFAAEQLSMLTGKRMT